MGILYRMVLFVEHSETRMLNSTPLVKTVSKHNLFPNDDSQIFSTWQAIKLTLLVFNEFLIMRRGFQFTHKKTFILLRWIFFNFMFNVFFMYSCCCITVCSFLLVINCNCQSIKNFSMSDYSVGQFNIPDSQYFVVLFLVEII